jgi:hypothetical protein
MARAKTSEQQRSRSKPNAVEELTRGITTLRELSIQIDDLSRDGFPYGEAVRARTELSLRETIRRLFGEKSPEYQAHKNHKLRIGNRTESALSTTLLKELIAALESQKAELLGLKPDEATAVAPVTPERTTLTAVPPGKLSESSAVPGAQNIAPLATGSTASASVTPIVATAAPLSQPVSSIPSITIPPPVAAAPTLIPAATTPLPQPIRDTSIPRPLQQPPLPPVTTTSTAPGPSIPSTAPSETTARPTAHIATMSPVTSTAMPIPSGTIPPVPHATLRPTPATLSPSMPLSTQQPTFKPLDTPVPTPVAIPATPAAPPPPSPETTLAKPAQNHLTAPVDAQLPPVTMPPPPRPASTPESEPKPEPIIAPLAATSAHASTPAPALTQNADKSTENGTLDMLRRICARFHLVARQLRLRKEYRPTLEINDEYDLQDLFYALLRLQFDEVGTEEWSPAYADGARRTSYLLDWDKTVVVVKQTRSGLTTKDLAEQVAADKAHYSARANGATLVCFIYDPDGRVGNPRGLEADLTSVDSTYRVEVIVAPK